MSEMSLLFPLRMLIMFRVHTVAGSLIQVNLYLKLNGPILISQLAAA